MNFKSNFYLFFILSNLVVPIGFLIRILYAKNLSIEDFGLLYAIISFFIFISTFTQFGLNNSILYYFPKFRKEKKFEKLKNSFWNINIFNFSFTLFISLILFILSNFLEVYYFKSDLSSQILKIFIIYFLSSNIINPLTYTLWSFNKLYISQILYVFQNLIILALSFLVIWQSNIGLIIKISYVWSLSLLFIALLYLYFLYKVEPRLFKKIKFNFKENKEIFNYGFYSMLSNLGNMILVQIDIITITYFLTTIEVGLYSTAVATINILFLLTVPTSYLLMPHISELQTAKKFSEMANLVELLYKLGLYLIIPFSLLFYLFGDFILPILFSNEFLPAVLILSWFAFFGVFKILYQYNINILNGLGKIKETTKVILFVAIFNTTFNIFFINLMGLLGVAIITSISWFLMFILTFLKLRKSIKYYLNYLNLIKILLINILFFLMVLFLKNAFEISNIYLKAIFVLSPSLLIYVLLGYILRIYNIKEIVSFLPENILEFKLFNKKW